MVIAFVEDHRDRFGVEPICRVLREHGVQIAPSTYYAARSRPASDRAVRDEAVLAELRRVHADRRLGRGLAGARKMYHLMIRQNGVGGRAVPRTVPARSSATYRFAVIGRAADSMQE